MWTEAAQIVCTRPRYFPPAWRKQKKPNWVENRPIWQHWRHVARVPWNPEISREWRLTNHIGVSDIGSPKALPISPSIWREILRFRFNNEISCINTFRYRSIYKTRPSWLLHTCAIRHCSAAKPGCTGSLHSREFTNYISPFIIIQVKNGNASRKTILYLDQRLMIISISCTNKIQVFSFQNGASSVLLFWRRRCGQLKGVV